MEKAFRICLDFLSLSSSFLSLLLFVYTPRSMPLSLSLLIRSSTYANTCLSIYHAIQLFLLFDLSVSYILFIGILPYLLQRFTQILPMNVTL